jgi:diguanylate cyclase
VTAFGKFLNDQMMLWLRWSLSKKLIVANLASLAIAFFVEIAFDLVERVNKLAERLEAIEFDALILWAPIALVTTMWIAVNERMRFAERERLAVRASLTDIGSGLPNLRALGRALRELRDDSVERRLALLVRIANRSSIESLVGVSSTQRLMNSLVNRLKSMLGVEIRAFAIADDQLCLLCLERVPPDLLPELRDRVGEVAALSIQSELVGAWFHLQPSFVYIDRDDVNPDYVLECARTMRVDPDAIRARRMGEVVLYGEKMRERLAERVLLEQAIAEAIAADKFEPHFEPVIELATQQTVALDCQARWRHATEAPVLADVFVPTATRLGHMTNIELRVFELAVSQIRRMPTPVDLWFNLSMQTLVSNEAVDDVISVIRAAQMEPWRITFASDPATFDAISEDSNLHTIAQLLVEGANFALTELRIDSVAIERLGALPYTQIKLARTLIENVSGDERKALVVKAAIDLAHSLQIKVTAMGVASKADADRLLALGCDYAEGSVFRKT